MSYGKIDTDSINAIRFLSADAIEQAKSGHPGLPMGAAPMAYVLWNRILRFNPQNPAWVNRDRFILSAGHGSMLQYALLYLTGYAAPTLDDIRSFRQWGSATPGHPENTVTAGVEVTTGPLGQGFANAVGVAMAERHLAARFNKPDAPLIDHYSYCLVGDGCLMEGITAEAASLAGHLGLGRLIVLYDDNHITIDGSTDLAFTENVSARFESYGWQVLEVADGNTDLEGIETALNAAKAETDRPTLIRVHTTIGFGSPNKGGTAACHGAPLGADELAATRAQLGWNHGPFEIPDDVLEHMGRAVERGAAVEQSWNSVKELYAERYPQAYAAFTQLVSENMPTNWESCLPDGADSAKATRAHSGACLNALADHFGGLFGGSADLSPSNLTYLKQSGDYGKGAYQNRNVHFGVREHAMGAICNGIALHGSGMIPFCATFLVFADYMRNAIRMSALSQAGVIYIFTHDSVAVGEDGPTHQPVEQVASLRLIPNLNVIRPADGHEVSGAYKVAIRDRHRPTALILTRQSVPPVEGSAVDKVAQGGYIVVDSEKTPELILIGTGSELHLCVEAAGQLAKAGRQVRVVSLPSWTLFEEQDADYRQSVLPDQVTKRLVVEAGNRFGWDRYTGPKGTIISIDGFGRSGKGSVCLAENGYTVENVVEKATTLLNGN